ncbi:hypothetical protein [Pseudodesulfovibrio sp.]|uniref:hypothetical protein n=1 Tax=unclassified Pseudodesulfovibrio TaxID=2661612 RepID=UPI003B00A1E6
MKYKVTYPLFIFEGQDLSVFLTPEDMAGYLEWQDVEEGSFLGFDFMGHILNLFVTEDKKVSCKNSGMKNGNEGLMKKVCLLLQEVIPVGMGENESATKALAVGLFVERSRTGPTFTQWLKGLFKRGGSRAVACPSARCRTSAARSAAYR